MNQMKQEGQFLRKEEHLQEEAGGWLWLEQDLESRDCGRKVACLGKEGVVPGSPQTKPVSLIPPTNTHCQ